MNNEKTLLTVIAVLLAAILGILVMQNTHHKNTGDSIAESIGEVGEEIKDEIDDHTTN